MKDTTRIALVTGANRGLGLETARRLHEAGLEVYLGCRDERDGQLAAQRIGPRASAIALDVRDTKSVDAAIDAILSRHAKLDVLVNNAGIIPKGQRELDSLDTPPELLAEAIDTNTIGAFRVARKAIPVMKAMGYGRVVNVSSGMGQLEGMEGGYLSYRLSKTALNALTACLAKELEGANVLINAVCPGWVKTDMGGPGAARTVEQGADGIVWAALLPDGGPTGGFFRDKKPIAW